MFDFNKGKKVEETKEEKPSSGFIEDASDFFEEYVLSPLSKFTGMDKVINLAEPIIEAGVVGTTSVVNPELANKMMLNKPQSKALQVAEDKGLGKSVQAIGGQALQAAAAIVPFASGVLGGGPLKFGAYGAGIGVANKLGEQLIEDDLDGFELVKEGMTDFAISATFGKLVESLGGILTKRSNKLYGRAFKPDTKSIQSDIEKGVATINEKMATEGYIGTAGQIRGKAASNKASYGKQIGAVVDSAEGTVYKKDVVKDLETLFEKNDVLDEAELNLIIKQINKLPGSMTVAEANQFKKQFAERVTASAWDDLVSKKDTFRNKIYKTLSGSLRKEVERFAPTVKPLNEKWAIALDTLSLASRSLAVAEKSGGLSEAARGGLVSLIMNLPVVRAMSGVASRTTRGQMYAGLSKLSKQDLIKQLSKYIILEEMR